MIPICATQTTSVKASTETSRIRKENMRSNYWLRCILYYCCIAWVARIISTLFLNPIRAHLSIPRNCKKIFVNTGCPIKKATQAFDSCSRTRVPILFKLTMDIVWKMAKIIVTKAKRLGVLPPLECVWLRRLLFCCFHWTGRSLPNKFSWDHPKTRLDFEKYPEQKDKSLRTPFASNYDRNRLWDVRQGCQPPPFGGPWACPRWSARSGPTSSAFFKSLLRLAHKRFMLITYITCFAIYLATQQCINFYFRGNISSFMTENNSSRFSGRLVCSR